MEQLQIVTRHFRDPFGPRGWLRKARPITAAEAEAHEERILRLHAALGIPVPSTDTRVYWRPKRGLAVLARERDGFLLSVETGRRVRARRRYGLLTPLKPLPAAEGFALLRHYWLGATIGGMVVVSVRGGPAKDDSTDKPRGEPTT